jgi:predicted enzyme related to lactoylglutathione lyase
MNTTSIAVVKLSVEVITLPVSDVERALRFYVDQVGFTLDVDYSPNDAFRVVQLTPPGSNCSIQIGSGLTDAPVGSIRSVYLVVIDLEAAQSRLLERGVEVGEIRHKVAIDTWDGGFALGLDPARRDTPASPTSRTRMATAGCYRNGVTARCDVL